VSIDSPEARLERARLSLEGLSVGDAFGETFFVNPAVVDSLIAERALASREWNYTDDTLMALSIFSILRQHGRIEQDLLASSFAEGMTKVAGMAPRCISSFDGLIVERIGVS
jgi:hypothetical protein